MGCPCNNAKHSAMLPSVAATVPAWVGVDAVPHLPPPCAVPPPPLPPYDSADIAWWAQRVFQLCCSIFGASKHIWNTPNVRPMQLDMAEIVLNPDQPNAVVAVFPTCGRKLHPVRIVSVVELGVVLIFIPLLTLLADFLAKFTEALRQFGYVTVLHLDDLYDNNLAKYGDAMLCIGGTRTDMTLTICVFLSPQFLVQYKDALQIMLHAIRN